MKENRERMLLLLEVLQTVRNAHTLQQACQAVVDQLSGYFQAFDVPVAVSICEFKIPEAPKSQNLPSIDPSIDIDNQRVVEAIASSRTFNSPLDNSQLNIEDILRQEEQWGARITNQIINLYASGLSRSEIDLAEMFADKDYLLVPIVLTERAEPLWGFLVVYRKALDHQSLGDRWNQEDGWLLHQVAMQIEIGLAQANSQALMQNRLTDAEYPC
jgi:GAF domain-containing protein